MARVLGIDELNVAERYVPTNKPLPYRQYFGEMELDPEEEEERIQMAEQLETEFNRVFALIMLAAIIGALDSEQYYVDTLYERYRDVVEEFGYSVENGYERLDDYIYASSGNIVQNTLNNLDNGYFFSSDRAMFCAEEEANSVGECKEFVKAVMKGKRLKTWVSMRDKRVRGTHVAADGQTVPITDFFRVGQSMMLYPRDPSGSPEEVVNCRCHAEYR